MTNRFHGGIPRIDNRKATEIWTTGNGEEIRRDLLRRLRDVASRHEAAKVRILHLSLTEPIPALHDAIDDAVSIAELAATERRWHDLVAGLEGRADELESDFASMSVDDKIKTLLGMVYSLRMEKQERGADSTPQRAAGETVPYLVGSGAAGLGGVSASFGSRPTVGGGGVRRLGSV